MELSLDEERFPDVGEPLPRPDWTKRMERYNENFALFTDSLKNILIEEVIISGQARKLPETPYEVLANKSVDYQKIEEENYTSITELLTRNGVIELGGGLLYRGRPVKFVIDGIVQDDDELNPIEDIRNKWKNNIAKGKNMAYGGLYMHPISVNRFDCDMIPIDAVKQIDIIPSNMTTLLGSRIGSAAAVVITTKDGSELPSKNYQDMTRLNMFVSAPLGYQKPAEFYSPKYETSRQRNAPERDLRTTVYWCNSLKTDAAGRAGIEFYTGDEGADCTLSLQGLTDGKKPVVLEYTGLTACED